MAVLTALSMNTCCILTDTPPLIWWGPDRCPINCGGDPKPLFLFKLLIRLKLNYPISFITLSIFLVSALHFCTILSSLSVKSLILNFIFLYCFLFILILVYICFLNFLYAKSRLLYEKN